MKKPLAEFPQTEYESRVSRACELMKRDKIDAIVVTGDFIQALNYRYFTGHVPRDFQMNLSRTHVMVLTQDGRAGLVVMNRALTAIKLTTWIEDIRTYNEPFHIDPLVELLNDLGLQRANIGFELGEAQRMMMPVGDFLKLQQAMKQANFVDAGSLLWELRHVKSDLEVECIREAAKINQIALDNVLSNIKVGMTERDIVDSVIGEIVNNGAFRPPHTQWQSSVSTRVKSSDLVEKLSTPSDEPLGKGDIIFVDTGAVYKGYWAEFGRMAVLGEPSKDQDYLHKVAREVVQKIIVDKIKPGVTGREIIEEVLRLYKQYGIDESQMKGLTQFPYSAFGHGIGLCSSEGPSLRYGNTKPLQAGMVLAVESSLQGDCRYVSEDLVHVTESGCEPLTRLDEGLYINKV